MVSITVQSLSRNHLTCQLIGWTQLMISYYLARLSHFQVDLNLFDWNCCDRLEVNDLSVTQHARIYHCRVYTCLPSQQQHELLHKTFQDQSNLHEWLWLKCQKIQGLQGLQTMTIVFGIDCVKICLEFRVWNILPGIPVTPGQHHSAQPPIVTDLPFSKLTLRKTMGFPRTCDPNASNEFK